jgi:glutamyl-tRNA synthetase
LQKKPIMAEREIRVRFAPSPTGPLHIGGVRTALYNYLFARRLGGKMILRIEDTDQTRFVPGAEDYIVESLRWCGIQFDEGVHVGGPHSPYRQSERKEMYHQYADALVKSGYAYYAFDSAEALEVLRKEAEASKKTFVYNAETRKQLKNSLTLPPAETEALLSSNAPYVIRILIPGQGQVVVEDLIRGTVTVDCSQLDDKVLYKSDGMPTYHLANVVDDHLMNISHVIRGEEWLPSAPMHVLLYQYLGWSDTMPRFAHLPLLLKPDGNGKLSKRDGDRLGFPVFPLRWTDPKSGEVSSGYRESGYFPEAFINMLAFLGWNPGTEQELFSMDQLIAAFSLERVGKAGSKFDLEKAKWFNHQYLIQKSDEELSDLYLPLLKERGLDVPKALLLAVCGLVKERVNFVADLWDQSWFFFKDPESWDEQVIKKRWSPEMPAVLNGIADLIEGSAATDRESLESLVKGHIQEQQLNMGQVMNLLRLCMVGSSMGPDLISMMALLGKEVTVRRIRTAVAAISAA